MANIGFVLSNNSLIPIDTTNPNSTGSAIAISGLAVGETLVGIDTRPQNGQIYGLATNGAGAVRLYVISARTGVATPISSNPVQFTDAGGNPVAITGTNFGIDFNPTVDRLRVVTDGGINFRMNPNTGAIVDGNGTTAGIQGDTPINGGATTVDAVAYTNNAANVTATTLYTLDAVSNTLFVQNPANGGTQTLPLAVTLNGSALDFTAVGGFEIPAGVNVTTNNAPATGQAIAALTVGGSTNLYGIELSTGAATLLGPIGTGTSPAQGFTTQSDDGLPLIGVDGANNLLRFSSTTPGTPTTVAISGLAAGESVVGIDYRPATGQLFAVTSNGAGGLRVAIVDPQTGAATALTTEFQTFTDGSGTPVAIAGTQFGVDFNPTVDRIRVVTDAGVNLRLNPNTGLIVDGNATTAGVQGDGTIQGGTTTVDATAYTNSFAGTTVTTQYTLDAATNSLFIQNPPNNGVQTAPLAITVDGAPLDFTAVNGFEIPSGVRVGTSNAPASGQAFAALTVGGATGLYAIELSTGAATLLGAVGTGTTALAGLTSASVLGDAITGTSASETLEGTVGDDLLVGLEGDDVLLGSFGDDGLNGGRGVDTLTGGLGGDRFIYSGSGKRAAFANSPLRGKDQVTDFSFQEGDKFQLDFDNNLVTPNLPTALYNAGRQTGNILSKAARSAFADTDKSEDGAQALRRNEAVVFGFKGRRYLGVNNGIARFDINRDLLVDITGASFKQGDAIAKGAITVSDYFV